MTQQRELLNNADDLKDANEGMHPQKEKRILKTDDPGKGPDGVIPNLEAQVVVGVFERRDEVTDVAQALRDAGFTDEHVSVVLQPSESAPETTADDTKAGQGTAIGASAGAIAGGLVGLAALAIPGIGPILAAGPIAAALGALTGGALGGLIGSFTGLGIPNEHAQKYEAAVRAGGVVVTVKTDDKAQAERAEQVLNQQGAHEVAHYTESL